MEPLYKLLSTIGFTFILINSVNSSGFGRCPNYPSMPKFNVTKFLGKWLEVERSFYLPEIATGCASMTFENSTARLDEGKPQLEIAIKTINLWTGAPSVSIGNAILESDRSSIMNVQLQSRLPAAISRLLPGSGKYQVLYTDYENFAILWSCANFGIAFTDQIWLLGREKDYSLEIRTKIYDALRQLGLDSDRLIVSKNKDCPNTLINIILGLILKLSIFETKLICYDVPQIEQYLHSIHCHRYFFTEIVMFLVNWRQDGCPDRPQSEQDTKSSGCIVFLFSRASPRQKSQYGEGAGGRSLSSGSSGGFCSGSNTGIFASVSETPPIAPGSSIELSRKLFGDCVEPPRARPPRGPREPLPLALGLNSFLVAFLPRPLLRCRVSFFVFVLNDIFLFIFLTLTTDSNPYDLIGYAIAVIKRVPYKINVANLPIVNKEICFYLAFKFHKTKMKDSENRISVYHERQSKELCAMHALNNLFQEKVFTKDYLDNICLNLAPDTNWLNPHRSMLGLGNYDINVIMAALDSKKDCEAIWFDKRKDPDCIVTDKIIGFILNIPNKYDLGFIVVPLLGRKHWISIKKIGSDFWNLDSKLKVPQSIGTEQNAIEYLRKELQEKDKELFIVVTKDVARQQSWNREEN
uniref:Josephin-2 n=1 Tax=Culicoides sonorensis TaxID=179676 RepID=A0A336K828_CULSO